MSFNSHYWPSLDNPGEFNLYQVNRVVRGAVHDNGQIDVLERAYDGPQYITLLEHPDYPMIGEVYSTDPNHNVPPTQLLPGCLYLAIGPDGIGEVRNNLYGGQLQIPPILLLPDNLKPGLKIQGASRVTTRSTDPTLPFDFKWEAGVTHVGEKWGPWPDTVRTWLHEINGDKWYNYIFASGEFGKPRGLVSFWTAKVNPDGSTTGDLEYWAYDSGKI